MTRAGGRARICGLVMGILASVCLLASGLATASLPPEALPREKPYRDFFYWVEALRVDALDAGISNDTFNRAFDGVTPDPEVLERDAFQPEFVRPVWEYLDSAVSDARIENGQAAARAHSALIADLEAEYGVDRHVLIAIWGLETSYGSFMGGKDTIRSLATLAFDSRRTVFFRGQLIAALKIMEAKDVERLSGSWAGAMGHTQFMPTTFLAHAVDGDGDGKRDIWSSVDDALSSAASYLRSSGWQRGGSWGEEVRLPAGFDYAEAELTIRKPVSEWAAMGITAADGSPLAGGSEEAAILTPAGHGGPAFLARPNFRAILAYNNSTSYAIGIGHLSDRISGAAPFRASWPRSERPLSIEERKELQMLLNEAGYDLGEVDGVIGIRSRAAIRAAQKRLGLVPDGFATASLLARIREDL